MRTNRGITIGLLSEGHLLEEHSHQNEDDYTVSCYIPGEANKAFEIFVSNDLPAQDVSISIRIDGAFIGRYFLGQGQNVLPGLYVSERVTKPFRFRALNIPDEQTMHDSRLFRWDNMGLMEFCIYRCMRTSRVPHIAPPNSPSNVSTGPARPIPPIEGVQGVTLDPPNEPYARVIFRYRPRAALQVQGVIRSGLQPSNPPDAAINKIQDTGGLAAAPSSSSQNVSSHAASTTAHRPEPQQPFSTPEAVRSAGLSSVPEAEETQSAAGAAGSPRLYEDQSPTGQWTRRLSLGRYNPYASARPRSRVPSRAQSLPEHMRTGLVIEERGKRPERAERMDADVEELAVIKAELARVYNDIQQAMRQIRGCVETVDASMRQLRFLQWQVEVVERRQRERLPDVGPSVPRANRRPLRSQHEPLPPFQPGPLPLAPDEEHDRFQALFQSVWQTPPPPELQGQPLRQFQPPLPPPPLLPAVKREPLTPEAARQLSERRHSQQPTPAILTHELDESQMVVDIPSVHAHSSLYQGPT